MANTDDITLSEIVPSLYLGNYLAAKSIETLEKLQITHILIVGEELEAKFPDKFFYFKVDALDNPNFDLSEYFDQMAEQFLNYYITNQSQVLLIRHCKNRVKSLFIGNQFFYFTILQCLGNFEKQLSNNRIFKQAYLLKYTEMTFDKAYKFVEEKRPIIHPNGGFRRQLTSYEEALIKKFKKSLNLEKFTKKQQEEFNKTYQQKKIERRLLYYTCYKCKACKKELFQEKDIVHQFNEQNSIPCTFMFIKNKKKFSNDEVKIRKPICCPNVLCKSQIGEYNVQGYKCTCSKQIDETAIKIFKPKIYPEKKTKELFELILKE